jgi:hypothetical protein
LLYAALLYFGNFLKVTDNQIVVFCVFYTAFFCQLSDYQEPGTDPRRESNKIGFDFLSKKSKLTDLEEATSSFCRGRAE